MVDDFNSNSILSGIHLTSPRGSMEDFVSEYLEKPHTENFLLDSWQIPPYFEREILEGFPFV